MPKKPTPATEPEGVVLRRIGDVSLELLSSEPQKYMPTGLGPLDEIIVGVVAGELTLIAAKPSQGKTALGMQILENAALAGVDSLIFSLEMGSRALAQRMISAKSGVPTKVLRTRQWPSKKHEALALKAAEEIRSLPLFIDDRSSVTGQQVYERVGQYKALGVQLFALDYLQLMSGVTNEGRQQQVGEAVRWVKAAAKDFDVPILALSQLNRSSDSREDKTPRFSDLRDSGELEQVADTIIMFHYPNGPGDEMDDTRECDLHVKKQRNGETGIASTVFNRPKTRFEPRE